MAEYTTNLQKNQGWNLTWSALGRYPMIAKRRFATLADAQAFVDDVNPGASATEGLILAVIKDPIAKHNGVYYVSKVANTDEEYGPLSEKGELIKVGGTETETAENYSAAVELSETLVVGQLIKVTSEETIGDGETGVTYQAGFYIVESAGVISALSTSTGSDDEVGALKARIDAIEGDYITENELQEAISSIEHPEDTILDIQYSGTSLVGEDKIVTLDAFAKTEDILKSISEAVSGKVDSNTYENKINELESIINGKTDNTEFTGHTSNADIHVTTDDKTKWNNAEENAKNYADTLNSGITSRIEVLEAIDHNAYIAADEIILNNAKEYANGLNTTMSERVAILEGMDVVYSEETKYINLVDASGNTIGKGFDASAFIVDGMLESVKPVAGEGNEGKFIFTFNVVDEETDTKKSFIVDFSEFIDTYTAGSGLILSGNEFSINFDAVAKKDTVDNLNTAIEELAERVTANETGITKTIEDIAAISDELNTKASQTDLEALKSLVGVEKTDDAEASGIFAIIETLATLVDKKANADNVYTKEEADSLFLTGITVDSQLNATSENPIQNKAVYNEFQTLREEIDNIQAGDVELTGYVKESELNTINDIALYGENAAKIEIIAGNGTNVTTSIDNKTITIEAKVSEEENNAISLNENGLFVQAILVDGDDVETLQ